MESFAAEDFDPHHARVLVVGPMSAGKTTLVHSLCRVGVSGAALQRRPPPTVGCNVDVKAGIVLNPSELRTTVSNVTLQ